MTERYGGAFHKSCFGPVCVSGRIKIAQRFRGCVKTPAPSAKARNVGAWGNAPGKDSFSVRSAEGAK
jgi:hypothetical protein